MNNKEVRNTFYSVLVPNIHQVQNIEKDRIAYVEIEGGIGERNQVNWLVYKETLKGWEPPYEMEKMSAKKRAKVFLNISNCLTFLEMPNKLV